MAWSSPLDTQAQWTVTDTDLTKDVTYRLLENGDADADGLTFQTDMFSVAQFINALNDRQRTFLELTGAILTRVQQVTTPQIPRYALPPDWIASRRVTWKNLDGQIYALFRTDTYALDNGMPDWMFDFADPTVFSESALPTLEMEVLKAPIDIGTLGLVYVSLGTTLTGLGVKLTVPDEWAPVIMYGAMADLLGSDGAGKDMMRAAYCERRFDMGVQIAKLLMEGQ